MSDDSSNSCVLSLSCFVSSSTDCECSGNSELEGDLGTIEPYQFEPSGSDSPAESDDSEDHGDPEDDDRLHSKDWWEIVSTI